jgi:hypothetical protein
MMRSALHQLRRGTATAVLALTACLAFGGAVPSLSGHL